MPPVELAPIVLRDVFPAEVAVGDDLYRSARVVITRERVYVWIADGSPLQVLDAEYDPEQSRLAPINAPRSKASHLTLRDSTLQVHVNGQRGCGCGSPLKAFTPWQPYRKGTA
jgi:hypothetical protein